MRYFDTPFNITYLALSDYSTMLLALFLLFELHWHTLRHHISCAFWLFHYASSTFYLPETSFDILVLRISCSCILWRHHVLHTYDSKQSSYHSLQHHIVYFLESSTVLKHLFDDSGSIPSKQPSTSPILRFWFSVTWCSISSEDIWIAFFSVETSTCHFYNIQWRCFFYHRKRSSRRVQNHDWGYISLISTTNV